MTGDMTTGATDGDEPVRQLRDDITVQRVRDRITLRHWRTELRDEEGGLIASLPGRNWTDRQLRAFVANRERVHKHAYELGRKHGEENARRTFRSFFVAEGESA